MIQYIDNRINTLIEEAKEELKTANEYQNVNLIWNDNFLDYLNFTPDFDFGQEHYTTFFYGCMVAISELKKVKEILLNSENLKK